MSRLAALLVAVAIGTAAFFAPSAPSQAQDGAFSHEDVRRVICFEGSAWDCETAMAVAWRESRFVADAYNPGCRCVGWFQIAGVHGYRADELSDPYFNVWVAHGLYLTQGWRPWRIQ